MKHTVAGLLFVLAVGVSSAAAQAPHPPMSGREPGAAGREPDLVRELRTKTAFLLQDAAVAADGVMGYAIGDLTDGDTFEHLSNVPFPTASTIKLAILYELVKRAGDGALTLDDTLRLDRARAVPGGLLYELGTPTLSLRDYANAMIIESDNTATNVLIERLGMDAINARMDTLGLTSIRLRRHMIDLAAARRGLENMATPGDLGRLLQIFHKGDGLSPAAQAEALTILKKHKDSPIRRAVPAAIPIASKTGGLEGVRSDTAIVYAQNRPFVIVVMGTFLQDEEAGDRIIERIAQVAYNYFSRLGVADSKTGRLLYKDQ